MANVCFSSIIPKYDNSYIPIIDRINNTIKLWCKKNDIHFIDSRPLFIYKNDIRFDKLLHLNEVGVISLAVTKKYLMFNDDRDREQRARAEGPGA